MENEYWKKFLEIEQENRIEEPWRRWGWLDLVWEKYTARRKRKVMDGEESEGRRKVGAGNEGVH